VLVAASDYLKTLPNMISKWMPRRLASLGTDGFGRSEGRASLRDFFEVDSRFITLATLHELSSTGKSNARFSIKPSKTSASTPRNLTRSSRSAVRTDSFRILSVANGALTSDPGLLPAWARVCGWLFLIGQTLFISRIVYESTVLTCVDGPQMVGFSMAHGGHSFFLLGLLFLPFGAFFFLVALVFGAVKRLRFSLREWCSWQPSWSVFRFYLCLTACGSI